MLVLSQNITINLINTLSCQYFIVSKMYFHDWFRLMCSFHIEFKCILWLEVLYIMVLWVLCRPKWSPTFQRKTEVEGQKTAVHFCLALKTRNLIDSDQWYCSCYSYVVLINYKGNLETYLWQKGNCFFEYVKNQASFFSWDFYSYVRLCPTGCTFQIC